MYSRCLDYVNLLAGEDFRRRRLFPFVDVFNPHPNGSQYYLLVSFCAIVCVRVLKGIRISVAGNLSTTYMRGGVRDGSGGGE